MYLPFHNVEFGVVALGGVGGGEWRGWLPTQELHFPDCLASVCDHVTNSLSWHIEILGTAAYMPGP